MSKVNVDLEILKARNGRQTLRACLQDGRKIFLHSAYDPEREARQWAERVKFGPNDVIALFGCGIGYAPAALRDRLSRNNHLLILDPLADKIAGDSGLLRDGLADRRIQCTATFSEFQTAYESIENACWKGISLLHLPTYERLFPEALKELAEWTCRQGNTLKIHRNTVFASARLWQKNLFRNLVQLPTSGAVSAAFGALREKPAIIVSAGPSLTRNMQLLREAQDRALIIATGTAARLLSIEGIPYHIVISVDPNPVNWTAHFAGISHRDAILVYDITTTPEVVAAHEGPKAAFYSLPDGQWINDFISPGLGILKTGGSVANIAFDLAVRMEADPIILIGQDLAYTDGLGNAPGTYPDRWAHKIPPGWFEKSDDEIEQLAESRPYIAYLRGKGRLSVPGIDGRSVWTDRVLFGFLTWFEEAIRGLGGKPRVIDATEGGALIAGTEVKPLAETLEKDCPATIEERIEEVRRRLSTPVRNDSERLLEYLDRSVLQLRTLDEMSRRLLTQLNGAREEVSTSLEREAIQKIDDLKQVLHFGFVPLLVRLQDFSSVESREWMSVRQSFFEHLDSTLRDSLPAMEETVHRFRNRLSSVPPRIGTAT